VTCPYRNEDQIDLLLDYSAGRLDAARANLLERHMAECSVCAAFEAGQHKIWQAMEEYSAPTISADFNRGVWRKIDAAAAEPWYRNLGGLLRDGVWKPVFPLAVVVLVVAAGFMFDHRNGNASSPVPAVTVAEAEQMQNTLEDLQLLQNLNESAAEVVEPIL
jgi:anti-sigma factor RsiW